MHIINLGKERRHGEHTWHSGCLGSSYKIATYHPVFSEPDTSIENIWLNWLTWYFWLVFIKLSASSPVNFWVILLCYPHRRKTLRLVEVDKPMAFGGLGGGFLYPKWCQVRCKVGINIPQWSRRFLRRQIQYPPWVPNIFAPENGWLEYDSFPFGASKGLFSGANC